MAGSQLEAWQRKLDEDPRSPVFVDLARELLRCGRDREAVEVCRRGLEHHPDRVEGRILLGRALLRLGRAMEARAHFEAVLASHPRDVEAIVAIGEALLERGLHRSSAQLFRKALQLRPDDPGLRRRLEQAEGAAPSMPSARRQEASASHPAAAGASERAAPPPTTRPARESERKGGPEPAPAEKREPAVAGPPSPSAGPETEEAPGHRAEPTVVARLAGRPGPAEGSNGPSPVEEEATWPETEPTRVERLEPRREPGSDRSGGADERDPAGLPQAEPTPVEGIEASEPPPLPPERTPTPRTAAPPPLRSGGPPPLKPERRDTGLDALFADLPATPPTRVEPKPTVDAAAIAAEVESVAAAYERELRERLAREQARPPSWLRRNRLPIALGLLLALGGTAGYGAYQYRRAVTWSQDAERYLTAARNGLLRDTLPAYQASVAALDEILDREPDHPSARALKAQALAVLATRFGIGDPADAEALIGPGEMAAEPEAVLATRWLVAEGEVRKAVEEEILAVHPAHAGATVHSLAGALLLERGQQGAAIERFNAAIAATPGHVPTLVRVAEHYRQRREMSEVLRYASLTLAVVGDHPQALLLAAEAQLALAQEPEPLEEALAGIDKVPDLHFPLDLRARRSIVRARLLAALDRRGEALEELARVRERVGNDESTLPALADAYVAAGAAELALELFPTESIQRSTDLGVREAWARALLARERFRAVTSVPREPTDRNLHLLEGIAWYRLGDREAARAALRRTATRQAGKLPADAVVYLALIDLEEGNRTRARRNLERLGTGPRARTTGRWAWARLLVEEGKLREAEAVLREARSLDRESVEVRCALGRLLLLRGDAAGARAALREALDRNPFHTEARIALGEALLGLGEIEEARTSVAAAIGERPNDAEALALMARIELRGGSVGEAERRLAQAERFAPRSPKVLRAKAELARAARHFREARSLLEQAVRSDGNDPRLWMELGGMQLAAGAGRQALASFERAVALDPDRLEARIGQARALAAVGQGKAAEQQIAALLDEQVGEESAPRRARLLATLAEVMGSGPAARAHAEEAVALAGDSPEARTVLGRILAASGEAAAAELQLRQALRIDPDYPEALRILGLQLLEQGDAEEGRELLERYLRLAPENAEAAAVRRKLAG